MISQVTSGSEFCSLPKQLKAHLAKQHKNAPHAWVFLPCKPKMLKFVCSMEGHWLNGDDGKHDWEKDEFFKFFWCI
ncbi:hypothetical protein JCM16303_004675 [Sporobolomyces ruberrimus]